MEILELPSYIKENLLGDLSINTLAKKCYSNPTSLKKNFKSIFGESIGAYIIRMRMYAAADKLTSGNYKKIADVVDEVGYVNMSNFARKFSEFFGYLPNACFIEKPRLEPAKESDIHTCDQVLAKLVKTCPDKLKDDFVNHFGKPISAFLFERKTASYSIKH